MDFNDFFKRVLGINNRNQNKDRCPPEAEDNSPLFNDNPAQDPNGKSDFSFSLRFPSNTNGENFGIEGMFGGDIFRQMNQMHKQMEEMMQSFGFRDNSFPSDCEGCQQGLPPPVSSESNDFPNEFPNNQNPHSFWFILDGPTFLSPGQEGPRKKTHLRDQMLKDDFIEEDDDDDGDGGGNGGPGGMAKFLPGPKAEQVMLTPGQMEPFHTPLMDKIMNLFEPSECVNRPTQAEAGSPAQPRSFFSSSSSSFSTITGPDGKMEQKRVVRKSDGSEETTITRSSGGQSHSVTTVRGRDGTEQTSETFSNMKDKDLNAFNQLWEGCLKSLPDAPKNAPNVAPSSAPLTPAPIPGMSAQDRDIFTSLFGKWK